MSEVRTRFAPSPTGLLHIGGLRTALYCYAFAKSQGGKFILRIEDTDRKRFVPGATKKIYEMLKVFGLAWDEGPYIQSERTAQGIYQKYAEKLIQDNHAYYCFCPKTEEQNQEDKKKIKLRDKCRDFSLEEVKRKLKSGVTPAIRLKVPDSEIVSYKDFIIGKEISWKTEDVDEVMLLKSDGFPTYHLAVTVDDALMEISHVVRGHDWLPSTPVHLLLMKYLNFPRPEIGHLTDILDPEGGKLSKRKGSVSCEALLAEGYLPQAILNFIMLLGWAPKDNRELFTLEEFVENFQKGSLQVANPIFNQKKLDWFNGVYLRQKEDKELATLLKPFVPKSADDSFINKTIPLVKERIIKLADYPVLAGFFFKEPKINKKILGANAKNQLEKVLSSLEKESVWDKEKIEATLQEIVDKEKYQTGDFFMNLRIAVAGSRITPPITDSVVLLGKEKTLARIRKALKNI